MSFADFVSDPDARGQYLVEITAFRGGEIRTGGGSPVGRAPVARRLMARALRLGNANAGTVTLRYGDRHWVGEPDDEDMPNVFYEGRVIAPLVIERRLPLHPEEPRRVQRQFGFLEIAAADGGLDDLVRYAVDGRRVRVLYGPAMPSAYADFETVAEVVGTGWEPGEARARLHVRGRGYLLEVPLQSTLYQGTGGAEGGAELKGKPKPIALGLCRNVTPTLVDPTLLIYQIHDGALDSVDGVYDRGAALTAGSDRADYAALAGATISAGHYDTCLAEGYIRLGSSPAGLVTADVHGPEDTLEAIALHVIEGRAGLSSDLVDEAAFAAADVAGGAIGLYVSSEETPTAAQVLDRLLGAVGGWWSDGNRAGLVTAGKIVAPETQQATLFLGPTDILSITEEEKPLPRWRQRVAYRPNWTPQLVDLASSVSDERRQFLAGPARIATWFDSAIRVRHKNAFDAPPLASLYDEAEDAEALAEHLGSLFGPDRGIWNLRVWRKGYLADLGTIVRVTYPRFGLSGGRNLVVIGIIEDAARGEIFLRVWG